MECQPTEDVGFTLNGAPHRARAGQTLLGLLEELKLDPSRVAIELDLRIVKRDQWPALRLAPGARIEIVQFVGGG
jgi:thiamine biosynthesis protein ThiS